MENSLSFYLEEQGAFESRHTTNEDYLHVTDTQTTKLGSETRLQRYEKCACSGNG